MKKYIKPIRTIAWVLFAIVALTVIICPFFQIHIFTFSMHGEYVNRVDCIEGYYVEVYDETVCAHDGVISFGNCDKYVDYEWKHEELLGITPYRRFLCFSKRTDYESYILVSEDETVQCGVMFVLRTSSDTVHYYYRRDSHYNDLPWAEGLMDEKITFGYDGKNIEMNSRYSFSCDVDFTTNEATLYIQGEPCRFIK